MANEYDFGIIQVTPHPSRSFAGAVTESSRESPVPMEKASSGQAEKSARTEVEHVDRLQLMMNTVRVPGTLKLRYPLKMVVFNRNLQTSRGLFSGASR